MTIVSARGAPLDLEIVRGTEFTIDFWEKDDSTGDLLTLTGYTWEVIFRKGRLTDPSTDPDDRFDWSAKVSLIGSDPLGANVVAKLTLLPTDTDDLVANAIYGFTVWGKPSGGNFREWLRGEVRVSDQL